MTMKINQSYILKTYQWANRRIRDIISLNNGTIVLLTDRGVNIEDKPEIILISKSEE